MHKKRDMVFMLHRTIHSKQNIQDGNMSAKMINQTWDTFSILAAIARSGEGLSVGEVNKTHGALTRGQCQRMIEGLMGAGMIYQEVVKWGRTGKKIYKLTEHCAIVCSSIARDYTDRGM